MTAGKAPAVGANSLPAAAVADSVRRVNAGARRAADVDARDPDGETALMRAAREGNLDEVRRLVGGGADVNAVKSDGGTALMAAAAAEDNLDTVRLLVDAGANVNAVKRHGEAALLVAAGRAGNLDTVRLLVDAGADVTAVKSDGATTLMLAAGCPNNLDTVRYLVDTGMNVNDVKRDGKTVLMFAAHSGDQDAVRFLVDAGADVNARMDDGRTALIFAVGRSNADIVRCLLGASADVNRKTGDGKTALLIAAARPNNVNIVQCLVDAGADVNAVKSDGNTVLMFAARSGGLGSVRCLVDAGAKVNAVSNMGETALLFAAARWGDLESVRCLVHAGANVNSVKTDGSSILQFASRSSDVDTVRFLVETGAKVNMTNRFGETALMFAALRWGELDTVRFLVDAGANVNIMKSDKSTALMFAARSGDVDLVRCLVDAGANVDIVNTYGETAVMFAAQRLGDFDIVRCLVDAGADVNIVRRSGGETALIFAADLPDNLDAVRCLVDAGADVNAKKRDGKTALMAAAGRPGELAAVQCLVHAGANVNAKATDGTTALLIAASRPGDLDLDTVRCLVDAGADVNAVKRDGKTALMSAAACSGGLDIVQCLLDAGAKVNVWAVSGSYNGWTALHFAADILGNVDSVRCLVHAGADINRRAAGGRTALMVASGNLDVDAVSCLVDAGADVNSLKTNCETALMAAAARSGGHNVVRCLVEAGADFNARAGNGWTALMFAAESSGNLDTVRCLVHAGADVNAKATEGKTALLIAAGRPGDLDLDTVRCLVDAGADVNAVKRDGKTALMSAAACLGGLDIVQCLLDAGADVNARASNEWSALMFAADIPSNLDTVRCLVGADTDINAVKSDGTTVLMLAAARPNNVSIVRCLVDAGADVNAVKSDGNTALMLAARSGDQDIVRCLVDAGADVNAVKSDGATALMIATAADNLDAVWYLVNVGADISARDANGQTAILIATQHDHHDILRLLQLCAKPASMTVNEHDEANSTPTGATAAWLVSPSEVDLLRPVDTTDLRSEYRAKWLDTDVVVKLFMPDASPTTFEKEVAIWHQLRHPNILKLYGACNRGHHLFVQEFASNGSVVDYLRSCHRVGGRRATPWKFLHEAALGLAYLHERGIVHGNLRGSNILIGSDELAKLTNFGVSTSATSNASGVETSAARFVSVRWQAPELSTAGVASFASDVYSLGLCIVEVATGEMPWAGKSNSDVQWQKEHWNPEDGPGYGPAELSADVASLVARMCCRSPDRRVSVATTVQLLEHFAVSEATTDRAVQPDPEPLMDFETYSKGQLARKWAGIDRTSLDGPHQLAYDDLDKIFRRLRRSNEPQPSKLLEAFHSLFNDFIRMIDTSSNQNRVLRLLSTRATVNDLSRFRRRVEALWAMLGGSSRSGHDRESKWEEQRAKQLEVFVSEVSQTTLVLHELETEEDRDTLLAVLKSEIDVHASAYSKAQLSALRKAYDDYADQSASDVVSTTSTWFLPWYELAIDQMSTIGKGGFGEVFLARWLDSQVVVKQVNVGNPAGDFSGSLASTISYPLSFQESVSRTSASSNPAERKKIREMFVREVEVWFGLSHPHIVRLFGACHAGTPFFACEYASNGSLDKFLRKHPDEIWQKLYEAALGVQYLQTKGIVHGDLKCNNIVVGADSKAKVTDFGLSSDSMLQGGDAGQLSGAWQWVAPECLEDGSSRLSFASDVYSFGMCIVEALRVVETTRADIEQHGQVPLPWGDLENPIVKYHVVRKRQLPMRPGIASAGQWDLVKRMCAYDPAERIKIGTVVTKLAKLAGDASSDVGGLESMGGSVSIADTVASVVAEMKKAGTDRPRDSASQSLETLYRVYDLLWDRLEHLSSKIAGGVDDPEDLRQLVDTAQSRARQMGTRRGSETPFFFTEAALKGYALHRGLDKIIEANGWVVSGDDEVHEWKSKLGLHEGERERR